MSIVVRAFPLRGSAADLNAFVAELNGSKKQDTGMFYREFGITHESWHSQETPNGTWVIVVTIIDDIATAAPRYAAATAQFHSWFKERVLSLTGVDANVAPLGPPTSLVFHWSETGPTDQVISK